MTSPKLLPLNDGRTIPQLGFGVYKIDDADVDGPLEHAFEVGYRHIDTAALYHNEAGVGRAIGASGIARDELFITTKLWNDRHLDAKAAFHESLDKLGLDYVDLYLIHWPAPKYNQAFLTAWQDMIELRAAGEIRSIGVCNFRAEDLDELAATGVLPTVNQIELHPSFPQTEMAAKNASLGVLTESWSPLGRSADLDHPVTTQIADALGATTAQVILAWHLAHGYVVIPKSTKPERIQQNWDSLDVSLTPEQIAQLDGLDQGNRIGPDPAEFS